MSMMQEFKDFAMKGNVVDLEHFPPDLGRYPYPAWRK